MLIAALASSTACVRVQTHGVDVRVNQLDLPSWSSEPAEPAVPYTPYAAALRRVSRQEAEVREALRERDWEDLEEETDEWLGDMRRLAGYADTTHDPARFQRNCDTLLRGMYALRRAAAHRNVGACVEALNTCDPALDDLTRGFPLTATKPRPSEASPANAPPRAEPSARP